MASKVDIIIKEKDLILATSYEKMVFGANNFLHLGWQGVVKINGKNLIFSTLGHHSRGKALEAIRKLVDDIKKQKKS